MGRASVNLARVVVFKFVRGNMTHWLRRIVELTLDLLTLDFFFNVVEWFKGDEDEN